jgi:PAS domain S-box-containing protein
MRQKPSTLEKNGNNGNEFSGKNRDLKSLNIRLSREIAERSRLEKELRDLYESAGHSEEEWKRMFDAAHDIIALISPQFEILNVNRTGCVSIGKERGELIGKKCYEVIHGLHHPIDGCPCLETVRTKAGGSGEVTDRGRNYIATASPVLDEKGKLVAFVHTVKDITDRRKNEEALRLSEERYRAIFENTGTAVAIIEGDTAISMVNSEFTKLTGYSQEEMVGKSWTELVLKEDLQRMKEYHDKRRDNQNDVPGQYECRYYQKSGRIRSILLTVSMVPGTKKSVVSAIDITERKLVEEKAVRQKNALKAINKVLRETMTCGTDEDVAHVCLTAAKQLTGSKFGFIGEVNEAGTFDTIALSDPGWEACRMQKTRASRLIKNMEIRGLWGKAIKQGKSLIANDPSSHPDSIGTPKGHPHLVSFLGVPLKYRGKTMGMIALGNKESGYDTSDRQAIEDLSVALVEAMMRKKAQKKIETNESRFRELFNNISSGVAVYEAIDNGNDFIFKDFNQTAERIENIKGEELIGRSVLQAFPGVKEFGLFEVFQRVWKTGKPEHHPISFYEDNRIIGWRENYVYKLPSGEIVAVYDDTSEQKLAEKALRESEERFRHVAEIAQEWIWEVDANGLYTYASPTVEKILGYKPNEIVGKKHFYDLFHPEDKDSAKRTIFEIIGKRAPFAEFQNRSISKNGNIVWLSTSGVPILGEKGNLVGYRGLDVDITGQKMAELQLAMAHERLQYLLSSTSGVIYAAKAAAGHWARVVSKNTTQLVGYDESEFTKDADFWTQHVHPADKKRVLKEIQHIFEKQHQVCEYRFLRKDGQYIWLRDEMKLVRDPKGNPVEVVGFWLDITERKQAEEGLKQSERRYRRLVELAPDSMVTVNLNGIVTSCNSALTEVTGYSRTEILGKHFSEVGFLKAAALDKHSDLFNPLTKSKTRKPFEIEFHRKDGSVLWVEAHISLLDDGESGKSPSIQVIARDISERRQLENERKKGFEKLRTALEGTVSALASATEMRDPYTAGHQQRVSKLACAIAKEAGLPLEQIEGISLAGLVHDVGKLLVPAEILSKPGKLGEMEMGIIRAHPRAGYDILKRIEFPWPVAQIVLQHHERMNGSGYPAGLSDGEIYLEARVLAVADVVEAMASHRPYRPARGINEALQEISDHKSLLYDARLVEACLRLFGEKKFSFD